VIEECERHGIESLTFEERSGAVFVTFRAQIGPIREGTPQVTPQATPQALAMLSAALTPRTRADLQDAAGIKDRKHFRTTYLDLLLEAGLLELTIPDKPRSPLQRYRTTRAGRELLERA